MSLLLFALHRLMPEAFKEACARVKHPVCLRVRPGNHSYYFISSYFEEHVTFHARALRVRAAAQLVERTVPITEAPCPTLHFLCA